MEDEFAGLAVYDRDDDAIGFGKGATDDVEGRIELCLVGRFITSKTINFTAMKNILGDL